MTYTPREFRNNLREAFEDVLKGKKVLIKRYGKTYQLVLVEEKK